MCTKDTIKLDYKFSFFPYLIEIGVFVIAIFRHIYTKTTFNCHIWPCIIQFQIWSLLMQYFISFLSWCRDNFALFYHISFLSWCRDNFTLFHHISILSWCCDNFALFRHISILVVRVFGEILHCSY